jgi:adenosylcobinamide amidohydrolase
MESNDLFGMLRITVGSAYVSVRSEHPLWVLSSAPVRGGWCEAEWIVNRRVSVNYCAEDPIRETVHWLTGNGFDPRRTVALLTAAHTEDAVLTRVDGAGFCLAALVTAGVGNATRAGKPGSPDDYHLRPGTINTILLVDGSVTDGAMVGAVITATEAKAAALHDLRVVDPDGDLATGTSTDAVVVAAIRRIKDGCVHAYAGPVSPLGRAVGCAVYEAVSEAIIRERRRKEGDR